MNKKQLADIFAGLFAMVVIAIVVNVNRPPQASPIGPTIVYVPMPHYTHGYFHY